MIEDWSGFIQGPCSKFLSGGLKKNAWTNYLFCFGGGGGCGGHAWEFLFNFRDCFITLKLLIVFHIFSDVAIGSQNSPSLN